MTAGGTQPDWIPERSLRRLNPALVDDPEEIVAVLERLRDAKIEVHRGTNRHAVPERATVVEVGVDSFTLTLSNFDPAAREQVFLNFTIDGVDYFLSAGRLAGEQERLELQLPQAIYRAERRDRPRRASASVQIEVSLAGGGKVTGREVDSSGDGLGVVFDQGVAVREGDELRVERPGYDDAKYAEVRRVSEPTEHGRWQRVGMVVTHGPRAPQVQARSWRVPSAEGVVPAEARESRTQRVAYSNPRGESLRALVDSVGDPAEAVFVVIPPAWGRTKESTVALAETILESFDGAGRSVTVVRFDGVRKRGESFNEAGCEPPIGENRRYTFSQGVRDIDATLAYLKAVHGASSGSVFLVTFSIASVEGRRAIVDDREGLVGGWVSIVGAVDPQSMIRVVSGGVDYFAGALEGLKFGQQYIQGLLLDIDNATKDAIEFGIAFLGDARRDMARVTVPTTWIRGEADAWTDQARVEDVLSVGDASRRRLIDAPTGHQLRTSREAMDVFGVATAELSEMAFGAPVRIVTPNKQRLRQRRLEERALLNPPPVDLRSFWRDYLVGREHDLGIELVSATWAYRSLMERQLIGLNLRPGDRVLDIGSGAGAFPVALGECADLSGLVVTQVDLVAEGLARARTRVRQGMCGSNEYRYVAANVDIDGAVRLPFADSCCDAVLASLLVNYLKHPRQFLADAARVLRPGGRLVLAGMKPDADVSRICVAGVAELRSGEARAVWADQDAAKIDGPLQEFISSGARLLDLEEGGFFQFWDDQELVALLDPAVWTIHTVEGAYGDPPQAILLVAERASDG